MGVGGCSSGDMRTMLVQLQLRGAYHILLASQLRTYLQPDIHSK